ncbi:MAG TPA: tRNA (adenosine(37)-N6)-dimethylallyltransferase MiaA [Planctomycetaceae bacterium]|nr:tRNA (adenosine(37)-N6)-dimethylallyltransferase MiaA [Planctomycetaceae bacterium]
MEFPVSLLQRCWFVAGPTASGKSAAAIHLAHGLNAEIISLDSMAIYRGMSIGTAKPSAADQQSVRHHMIDIADPAEDFSVTEFVQLALNAVNDIVSRDRVPLFVGGTGLYLRSILRGMFEGPDADWNLRNRWQQLAIENGPEWLHGQLTTRDPVTARRLHPNDMRRIIRAIEVFELTGKPLSEDQHHKPRPPEHQPACVVWLSPPRKWLHDRINRRIDQMMQEGWLEETRALLTHDPPPGRTARQALGYRELIRHVEGEITLAATMEQIKISTRQFAKRQHTWFRNLEECLPLEVSGEESPEILADRIWSMRRSHS